MSDAAWDGIVIEVWGDGDTFTVELRREGSPDLVAEFLMSECKVNVEPGDLLIIQPGSVVKRDLGVWTQEEIDDINARAKVRAAQFQSLAD